MKHHLLPLKLNTSWVSNKSWKLVDFVSGLEI